jgi:hypothetical protein
VTDAPMRAEGPRVRRVSEARSVMARRNGISNVLNVALVVVVGMGGAGVRS